VNNKKSSTHLAANGLSLSLIALYRLASQLPVGKTLLSSTIRNGHQVHGFKEHCFGNRRRAREPAVEKLWPHTEPSR
jgi:hypothetical protein